MKKIIAVLSAAALVSAVSVTAFAADVNGSATESRQTDVTVSASISPAYIVSVPANTSVAFNSTTTDFGSVKLESARLAPKKSVKVSIVSDGTLNNSADSTAVIPYRITADDKGVGADYAAIFINAGDKTDLKINITQADWDAAAAGDYSDIVNFTISYVDAV